MRTAVLAALLTLLGSAAALTAILVAGWLKLSLYRIETGSMAPDFPVGTLVVDSGRLPLVLHRAVTFTTGDHIVTHVLTGYHQDGSLITRGLANPTDDHWPAPVHRSDVRGRVVVRILLLAPAFWLSERGLTFASGLVSLVGALYLWRRTARYPRLQSSSK